MIPIMGDKIQVFRPNSGRMMWGGARCWLAYHLSGGCTCRAKVGDKRTALCGRTQMRKPDQVWNELPIQMR